jgi:hypothetical protein
MNRESTKGSVPGRWPIDRALHMWEHSQFSIISNGWDVPSHGWRDREAVFLSYRSRQVPCIALWMDILLLQRDRTDIWRTGEIYCMR